MSEGAGPSANGQPSAPPTLQDILSPLEQIPEASRTHGCNMLLQCMNQLEAVRDALEHRKTLAEEGLADQET